MDLMYRDGGGLQPGDTVGWMARTTGRVFIEGTIIAVRGKEEVGLGTTQYLIWSWHNSHLRCVSNYSNKSYMVFR
jgi:hypothetical protein